MVIAGTKVDGAGEERSQTEQESAVVKQGRPAMPTAMPSFVTISPHVSICQCG